LVFDITHDMTH